VSEFESPDLSVARRSVILDTLDQHADLADLPPAPGDPSPSREGLPAGYRMRAETHYVDALLSRRADALSGPHARPALKEPLPLDAADPPGEWRDRRESRERRGDRVLAQLADDVTAIEAAAGLLTADASPLARRASADLIHAHAWRAAWLIRANAILGNGHRSQFRPRPLGALLDRLRDGFAAECRMTGLAVQVHAGECHATVTVDEPALVAGLTGAVLATLGVIGQTDGAAITLTAVTLAGELRTIEVAQDDVAVPPQASARFFDASWSDRPGGWMAGLGAATAKAVAHQHGGDAVFTAREGRGSTLRLNLNRTV
jgi:hypothetical protein